MAAFGYGHKVCWSLVASLEAQINLFIRMATDLNLHRKSTPTNKDNADNKTRDMEVHNRERTWLLCYVLDRSMSAQMGKPHSIREEYVYKFICL